jgi:hypothetical protein
MKDHTTNDKPVAETSDHSANLEQYYSVEISVHGLNVPYQFKIWQITSRCVWVLVKEDSDILPLVKRGDTLNIKCYPANRAFAPDIKNTTIRHITMNDQGRFKGHYLVGLEILESQGRKEPHHTFEVNAPQPLPLNAQ